MAYYNLDSYLFYTKRNGIILQMSCDNVQSMVKKYGVKAKNYAVHTAYTPSFVSTHSSNASLYGRYAFGVSVQMAWSLTDRSISCLYKSYN
jgi:hypothetical protein